MPDTHFSGRPDSLYNYKVPGEVIAGSDMVGGLEGVGMPDTRVGSSYRARCEASSMNSANLGIGEHSFGTARRNQRLLNNDKY